VVVGREVSRLSWTWTDVEWTTRLSVGGVTVRSLLASIDLFKWFVVVVVVVATLRVRPSQLKWRSASAIAAGATGCLYIACSSSIRPFKRHLRMSFTNNNVNTYHLLLARYASLSPIWYCLDRVCRCILLTCLVVHSLQLKLLCQGASYYQFLTIQFQLQ